MDEGKQVISLDLAKQLKELGVKRKSQFIWQQTTNDEWYVHESALFDWGSPCYPAYTIDELSEVLQGFIQANASLKQQIEELEQEKSDIEANMWNAIEQL